MASIFGSWGADPFAELVEKATSELLPAGQEDIALNLEICDQVRAKQVPPKQAMQTIRRRLSNKNPNVVLLTLGLTDICIKNGGDHFLAEVASREFMDNLASILRNPSGVNFDVEAKALRLIQNWAQISETKPYQMGYIIDTYKSLKASGFDFPHADPKETISAALVETLTAPEWTDSDVCMRCRSSFTTFNRKHHCRNCGNVFCQDCSSKSMALPWFGVGQDVRVCESCYTKKAPPKAASGSSSGANGKLSRSRSTVTPSGRGGAGSHHRSNTLGASSSTARASGSSSRRREDDDLALAIKLSLESSGAGPSNPARGASAPPVREGRPTKQANGRMMEGTDADDDPDLAAAIAASLRDYAPPAPSAPDDEPGRTTPRISNFENSNQEPTLPLPPSLDLPATDVDAILTFSQNAYAQEMYARQHGQWQANTGQHQQLHAGYERATMARPRVAKSLDEATRRQGVLGSMHDKLSEAVRLYDRLLDAQLNRPAYWAYGSAQPSYPSNNYRAMDAPQYGQQQASMPPQQYYDQPSSVARQNFGSQQYAQENQLPSMYPSLPSQAAVAAPPSQYAESVSDSQGMAYPASTGYMLPESPSPYPNHAGYFAPTGNPQYAHHMTNMSADVRGEYAPQGSSHSFLPPQAAQQGNAANAPQWQQVIDGLPSAPDGTGAQHNAQWSAVGSPAQQTVRSPQYRHPSNEAYDAQFYNAPQQGIPVSSLNDAMSSMALGHAPDAGSPRPVDATGVGARGVGQMPNILQQQTGQQQQIPAAQKQVQAPTFAPQPQMDGISSPNGNVPSAAPGWQNVPIIQSDSVTSSPIHTTQAQAARKEITSPLSYEPNGALNFPSVPSAPFASPPSKQSAGQSIAVGYDGSAPSQPQPWTRPVETPLIDL